ncbi:MAG: hydrogenase 3 maturation endopeptidase HyCI [Planctomycetota bacterium]|jgi:hydrogenase 3 maturation protease
MGTEEQLLEKLSSLRGSRAVIMGVGNTLKGDDGAGPLLCEKLKEHRVSAEVIDAGTVPENYIQPVVSKAPDNLLIVDAIDFGGSPGEIEIFRPEQLKPTVFSTHRLSPRLFVDMVKNETDVEVYFVGIQPGGIKLGESLGSQMCRAVERLTNVILEIFPPDT